MLSLAPNLAYFAFKGHYRCFTITANTCINVFYNIHLNGSLKFEKKFLLNNFASTH